MRYKLYLKYGRHGFSTPERKTIFRTLIDILKTIIFTNVIKEIKKDENKDKKYWEEVESKKGTFMDWPNNIGTFLEQNKPKHIYLNNWIKEKNIPYKFGMGGYRDGELDELGFYKENRVL